MHDRYFAAETGEMLRRSIQAESRTIQSGIDSLLEERSETCNKHGPFSDCAKVVQAVKAAMAKHYTLRTPSMNYALDQIAGKLGRIANGDPFYADHWRDIAGYATLVANELARSADPDTI